MKKILLMLTVLTLCLTLNAAETVTAYFTVNPPMSCANCEKKIKDNLRFEKGVNGVETSLSGQVVTVKYDPSKTNEDKIVAGFKKIGYSATATDKPSADCKKADCKKADRRKADCRKADCRKADCKKADCKKADCKKADCKKADCKKADCKKADCKNADCKKADCKNADCKKADCKK